MDELSKRVEALIEKWRHGTVAEAEETTAELRSMTPEVATRAFRMIESSAAEERRNGCQLIFWLLHAHVDEPVPIPPAIESRTSIFLRLLEQDPDETVRGDASGILSWMTSPEALAAICDSAAKGRLDAENAAAALGGYAVDIWDSPRYQELQGRVIAHLLELTRNPDLVVRGRAVRALGHGGHDTPEVRDRVLETINDPDRHVRAYSAQVLGAMREPRLVPILETRLRDADEMRAAGWGYFDAVSALEEPALLSAAEAGARIMRRIRGERGGTLDTSIESTLARLREAAQPND